jgi:hypothetical protein
VLLLDEAAFVVLDEVSELVPVDVEELSAPVVVVDPDVDPEAAEDVSLEPALNS